MISIKVAGISKALCSGWIYNETRVVTTANCVGLLTEGFLCLGSNDIKLCENRIYFTYENVIKHPLFKGSYIHMTPEDRVYDISIINLKQAIHFGPQVGAIGVVRDYYTFSYQETYTAYGYSEYVLRGHNFNFRIRGNECANYYPTIEDQLKKEELLCYGVPKDPSILDLFRCSKGKTFKSNIAQGDSGGGIYAANAQVMAGMIQGGTKGKPLFFIPLAQHHRFITT